MLFLLFGAVYIGVFGPILSEEELRAIKNQNASELYSADGKLLGRYYFQNRSSIDFDEIPKTAIEALIATEDNRFFEHEGIDFYSIPRVVIKTIILGDRSGGGGSTISQQLIKNLYGRKNHGALSMPVNKLKENIAALKLEDLYAKEEIIALYLNTVSFGEDVYGLKAASERYFSKSPARLNTSEAAVLIGMLKATTSYNPRLNPEDSKNRRNTVLALMVREGSLAPDAFQKLKDAPIELKYHRLEEEPGSAPYLRVRLESEIKELLAFTEKENGEPYNLYADGLKIELTVNAKLQVHAERVLTDHMEKLQKVFDNHWKTSKPWSKNPEFLWTEAQKSNRYKKLKASGKSEAEIKDVFQKKTTLQVYAPSGGYEEKEMTPLDSVGYHQMILQAGFIAIDAFTGKVLAYSGGVSHSHFPYDHVFSKRQVGSTFKPFVYAAAIDNGMKPCDYLENEPIIFSNYDDWSPQNSGGSEGGFYTLKGGLANSVNTIAARLIAETGPQKVRATAQRAGITGDIPNLPSIALGVADLSLYEMAKAYAVFATSGKTVNPYFIEKISTEDGIVLYEAEKKEAESAMDEYTANAVRNMMELVVDSGTARSARTRFGIRGDLAGKTGTTQSNADGWFLAITPRVVCGSWVGAQSPTVRFRSTALGQGAATALPITAGWLKKVESDPAVPNILGRSFPENSAELEMDLYCPLYVESRTDAFFDNIFDGDKRKEKRELRKKAREEAREEDKDGEKEKDGWIKRLFKKLGKDKD
ncbi:MAG: transglycosylase domain-containing protein [Cryomorphaceae bacterium]